MGVILSIKTQYYSALLCLHSDETSDHVFPEPKPAKTDTILTDKRMAQNRSVILFTKPNKTAVKVLLRQRSNVQILSSHGDKR